MSNYPENQGLTEKESFNIYDLFEDVILPDIRLNVSDIAVCAARAGSPYFYLGTQNEITSELRAIAEAGQQKLRFPMFAFEINETSRKRNMFPDEGIFFEQPPVIWVLYESNPNLTTAKRLDEIYKPTIYPLYNRMLTSLSKFKGYYQYEYELEPHDVEDMFNTSTPDDSVDGIQITNLNLKIRKTYNHE